MNGSASVVGASVTSPMEIDFRGFLMMDSNDLDGENTIDGGGGGDGNSSGSLLSYLENSTEPVTWDAEFRDLTRFWVQKILMPAITVLGVLGNITTVFILSRKHMRYTSSNIYLTALAISDLIFLIFSFSMSWRHYELMKGVWLYWSYVPFGLWITDFSSSTSVWLTVSFTIERYIAVCHPMTGKAWALENRAKYVSLIVAILCFLLTASTPFEWKCVAEMSKTNNQTMIYVLENTDLGKHHVYRLLYHWFTILFFVVLPLFILAIVNVFLINAVRKSRMIRDGMTNSHLHYQRRIQIMRQEDRITITLIAVVIMFLICQVPTATVLIYTSMNTPCENCAEQNVLLGLGNIFNMLVAINAACNFILYTALSDKYRRVFVNVLVKHTNCWGYRRRRERCRRVVYATPTHLSRVNGNTIGIVSNIRSAPPKLTVSGFVSIQNPNGVVACSTCGEAPAAGTTRAGGLGGEMHELKVLTLLRKKGANSVERFYSAPPDSGGYSLAKGFQSI